LRSVNFTGDIYTDPTAHPNPDELEQKRVGRRWIVGWRWWQDIEKNGGGLPSHVDAQTGRDQIFAAFWSHTLETLPAASARDQAFDRRLRDHYTYVAAPLFKTSIRIDQVSPARCLTGNCQPWINWNMIAPWDPDPTRDRGLLGISSLWREPHMIACAAGCAGVAAVSSSSQPALDVSDAFSFPLGSLIESELVVFLSPVERDDRVRALGASTQFVAMPRTLEPGSVLPELQLQPTGTFAIKVGETIDAPEARTISSLSRAASPAGVPFRPQPGHRRGQAGVLSLSEGAAFVVGGRRAGAFEGRPARDFWRYELETASWTRILRHVHPLPLDVQALTYDYNDKKLLVLDQLMIEGTRRSRILEYDTVHETGRTLAVWPKSARYTEYALTALDDGSAMLSATDGAERTDVYRFGVTDGTLRFTGFTSLQGKPAGAPLHTARGVYFLLLRRGERHLIAIADDDFRPINNQPSQLLGMGNGSGILQKPAKPRP
jgi:hypothetical protein